MKTKSDIKETKEKIYKLKDEDILKDVGANIAKNRKKIGLTQFELATVLSLTRSAISQWENGLKIPRITEIYKMAYLFNISFDELITGVKSDNQFYHMNLGLSSNAIDILKLYTEDQFYNICIGEETYVHSNTFLIDEITKTISKIIENTKLCELITYYFYENNNNLISSGDNSFFADIDDETNKFYIDFHTKDYHCQRLYLEDIPELLIQQIIHELKIMKKEEAN